jgi:hypothetical protein
LDVFYFGGKQMKKNHLGIWSGVTLVVGALCIIPQPVKAGPITLTSGDGYSFTDNFSNVTRLVYDSVSYQTQQGLTGAVDPYFSTVGGTNVDVLGNITPVLDESAGYNLTPFEGICAANDATADCIDLDGTGGNPQATLQATVDVTTAGTVVLTSDLLGTSGYLSTTKSGRAVSTSTTIVFGNAACIASPSAGTCLYYNDLTLNNESCYNASNPSAPTSSCVYDEVSSALTVGVGTYYVEYISNTAGQMGSLLAGTDLVETPADPPSVPEPATLVLLGSALLGLGGVRRFRVRL